jgi:hypothetical protein
MASSIFHAGRARWVYPRPAVGRAQFAAAVWVVVGGLICANARADTALPDVVHSTVGAPPGTKGAALAQRFAGSAVEVSSYIGSGTFYDSGYHDPYVSIAIFARPTYDLGTRYKLAVSARLYVETELTAPDNPEGRHFYPYDPWLWLSAQNLHTFERSKIRIGGVLRTIIPVSYESRYQHLIFGLGVGLNANRQFDLGHTSDKTKQWTLTVSLASLFYKYVHSSDFRGTGPGDTSGCRAPDSAALGGATASDGVPAVSASDRCGGPANPSFSFQNGGVVAVARGKLSLTTTLLVVNTFSYEIPLDQYSSVNAVARGRTDTTWGIIAVGYQVRPRIGLSAGISSQQPALDSRYQNLRFPFFDLSGGLNANNYTQLFVSVSGTL